MSGLSPRSLARARRHVESAGGTFAGHTGQDARAWEAFVHLLALWVIADAPGRAAAKVALAATLATAQRRRDIHRTFALAIVAVSDGCDLAELWPHLDGIADAVHASEVAPAGARPDAGELRAVVGTLDDRLADRRRWRCRHCTALLEPLEKDRAGEWRTWVHPGPDPTRRRCRLADLCIAADDVDGPYGGTVDELMRGAARAVAP